MPKTYFPAIVELFSLNEKTGFKINGEAIGDVSGYSVSNTGDINGDGIDDIIIGAYQADPFQKSKAGTSYVVFGKKGIAINSLELSSLNGTNGFKIYGEAAYDNSGRSVSGCGDINGDGIDDFIIMAPYASPFGKTYAGSSYVIFGKTGSWPSSIVLGDLDGITGSKINGASYYDLSGWSASGCGDINADGIGDFIIGAPHADPDGQSSTGSSYVLFGKSGTWPNSISLADLDETTGFEINGENAGDLSGCSVGGGKDINDDGIDDFIIGSCAASSNNKTHAGSSYVIFGKLDPWSNILELSALNETTGFKINGEAAGDESGYRVSIIKDINGDGIDDIVIGAQKTDAAGKTEIGSSYVIFGKPDPWPSTLELSALDGITGFKINGEATGDRSGCAISTAGDINNDGIADLIIGAFNATNAAGSSYVIFGQNGPWTHPFELSSLDGKNGFKMLGESANDWSGLSVSGGGDINGDGISDLVIGGPAASPSGRTYAGSIYVFFGDMVPELTVNQLVIREGETKLISRDNLNTTNINPSHNHLQFKVTTQLGQFEYISNPGISVTNFSKQDIENGLIQFAHDGGEFPPAYNVTVYTEGFAYSDTFPADIIFTHVNDIPKLTGTPFSLNYTEHETKVIDPDIIITDPDNINLVKATISITHNFHNDQDILKFTNQNGISGKYDNTTGILTLVGPSSVENYQTALRQIEYYNPSDDPTTNTRTITFTVNDGKDSSNTIGRDINILSENDPPILVNNQITITEGQNVTLTSNELSATDPDNNDLDLEFTITNAQYGQFKSIYAAQEISTFTQHNISQGDIYFIHNGSHHAPAYFVQVSDKKLANIDGPQPADIHFTAINDMPVLIHNALNITQGQTEILTNNELSATDEETPDADLTFTISDMQHGYFYDMQSEAPITNFAQSKITDHEIKFIHDNSQYAPNYAVSVNDVSLSTPPALAAISFFNNIEATESEDISDVMIAGIASGMIGLLLLIFRFYTYHKATKSFEKLTATSQKNNQERQINGIRPIAKAVFDQIKITGCLGYISDSDMKKYLDAVTQIITQLKQKGMNINFESMSPTEQTEFTNNIATSTRKILLSEYDNCTFGNTMLFFKRRLMPDVSPQTIKENAEKIAQEIIMRTRSSKLTNISHDNNLQDYTQTEPENKEISIELGRTNNIIAAGMFSKKTENILTSTPNNDYIKDYRASIY